MMEMPALIFFKTLLMLYYLTPQIRCTKPLNICMIAHSHVSRTELLLMFAKGL